MRPAFQLVAHDWNEIVVLQKASLPSSLCSIRLPMAVKVKHKTFYVFCCENQALVVEDICLDCIYISITKREYYSTIVSSNLQILLFSYFATSHLIVQGNRKNFFMFSEFVVYSNFLCNFALNWSQSHFVCESFNNHEKLINLDLLLIELLWRLQYIYAIGNIDMFSTLE